MIKNVDESSEGKMEATVISGKGVNKEATVISGKGVNKEAEVVLKEQMVKH